MPKDSAQGRPAGRDVAWAAFCLALMLAGRGGVLAASAAGCPAAGREPVVLAAIEPRLELRLADGRLVRLVGIDAAAATPGDPGRAEAARASLLALVNGRHLSIAPLAERADRWGRIPAWAFTEIATPPGGVAATAIAAGLARYRPEPDAAPCRSELLAAEAAARGGALGLWRDPYYSVLAVDDLPAIAERAGTAVIAEARLVAVEPGPYRTRLRFAGRAMESPRSGRRLEATIVPRAMKTFEAQGVDFRSLIGRTLRLHGLLDRRFGPRIELARPDQVEILPANAPGPPPAAAAR